MLAMKFVDSVDSYSAKAERKREREKERESIIYYALWERVSSSDETKLRVTVDNR